MGNYDDQRPKNIVIYIRRYEETTQWNDWPPLDNKGESCI